MSHENPVFPGELPISVDGPATLRTLEHVTARGTLVHCKLHGPSPNQQFQERYQACLSHHHTLEIFHCTRQGDEAELLI